jgi:hypothetical protein
MAPERRRAPRSPEEVRGPAPRSPQKAWNDLKDNALAALDHRIAAEILLLFYEDRGRVCGFA